MKAFTGRILGKTVSYRFSSTIITVGLVYFFTGKASLSLAIGGLDVLLKTGWYYAHERIWAQFDWGKYDHDPCENCGKR